MIAPIARTLFRAIGAIGVIIWKPALSFSLQLKKRLFTESISCMQFIAGYQTSLQSLCLSISHCHSFVDDRAHRTHSRTEQSNFDWHLMVY